MLEAGTNHPGELTPLLQMMSPRFGVVTNIGREHLEFFHDLVGVVREEGSMAECLPADGVLFLNGDDPWSEILARRTRARVVLVGLDRGNDYVASGVRVDENGAAFTVQCRHPGLSGEYRIKLLGRHQITNALLALAVGAEMGLQRAEIQAGLLACAPAKMRLQMSNPAASASWTTLTTPTRIRCWRPCKPCANCRARAVGWPCWATWPSWAIAPAPRTLRLAGARPHRVWTNCLPSAAKAAPSPPPPAPGGSTASWKSMKWTRAAMAVKEFARPGDVVLVKASRSMRLERITEKLRETGGNGQPITCSITSAKR